MKIHIDIRNDIDPVTALYKVVRVIQQGRMSNNGKSYCYATGFNDDIIVSVRENRKSDYFVVYKKGQYER